MLSTLQAAYLEITYPFYAVVAMVFAIFFQVNKIRWRRRMNLPFPPGPKGWPIIGNYFDVPQEKQWVVYHEWFKVYGDIIYFEVLGQPFLVLGSLTRTRDIFEKRSSKYSERARMPMINELMGWDYNFGFLPYGTWWRRHRRAFNNYFTLNVVKKYQPIQGRETRSFLYRLLISPDDFMDHIRHVFAATIMSISYGIAVKDSEDSYIWLAEDALAGLAAAGIPGSFWVDIIPLLKYVPSWFPGASFKRKAAHWMEVNKKVIDLPFEHVEEQVRKGTAVPSIATALLDRLPSEKGDLYDEERKIAQDVTAVSYLGGADTTVSSVQAFFLAMALYPEAQGRAQAELDAVVGKDRLPDFSDQDALPYVSALVKEILRWHLVVPLALSHTCLEDDEYDGYFIPKGTIVLGNAWSILHDPAVFTEPMEFRPERYLKDGKLDPDARDPECAAFGFGRRICPGRHLSKMSLYSIISCVLAVYDIKSSVDENGNMVKPKADFTSGMLSYPVPFQCVIKPRSGQAESLIRDAVEMDH